MNHNTEPHGNQRLPQGPRVLRHADDWSLLAVNHVLLTGAVATEPRRRPGLDQPAVAFRLQVARPDGSSEPLHVDIVCPPPLSTYAAGLDVDDHLAVCGHLDHNEWVADDGIRRARWQVIAHEVIVLRPATRSWIGGRGGPNSTAARQNGSARKPMYQPGG